MKADKRGEMTSPPFQLSTFRLFYGQNRMIQQESLKRRLARLAAPIFIETLLIMMLGAVDTVMLSRHSDNSVAAVGLVNQIVTLTFLVFEVINLGTSVLCSQYLGARLHKKVVQVVGVSLLVNFAVGVTVSGSITCFGSEADSIRVELIKSGQTAAAHQSELTGSRNADGSIQASYFFSAVAAGTYTLRVSKNNHVTREYTITVGAEAVMQDVKIHLKGDVNGDGWVNAMDVNRINLHARGKSTLTGYAFACADINGDGWANAMDVNRVNLHARGKTSLW